MNSQRGSIAFNVLLFMLLVVIGVLIYLLSAGHAPKTGRVIGVAATPSAMPTQTVRVTARYSDGLGEADESTEYPLDDFGEGIAKTSIYNRDINGDGYTDRITRTRHENGTDHFYEDYKIEINVAGNYTDITPENFRTIEGADCALQKLRFIFQPEFQVIKISRPWQDSWDTPTMATKTVYSLTGDQLRPISTENLKVICNVADLLQ